MKIPLALVIAACFWVAGQRANSQIVDWGRPVYSDLVKSEGQTPDQSFAFEIGAFLPTFIPAKAGVTEWAFNRQVFNTATYNGMDVPAEKPVERYGYFTSTVQMLPGSHSLINSNFDFQGRNTYLGIRNNPPPEPGTEWLLSRAKSWTFPAYDPNYRAQDKQNIQWSVSDLTAASAPQRGIQASVSIPGEFTNTSVHALLAPSVVPEPSTTLLVTLAAAVAVLRRRRDS